VGARFGVRRTAGRAVTLTVTGDVDFVTAPAMIGAFQSALAGADADADDTLVDLGRTSFMDSMAVAALLACRRAALDAGRTFTVVNATGIPARVLRIAGLSGLLGLVDPPGLSPVPLRLE
jgi:anti-anti-sigma factor